MSDIGTSARYAYRCGMCDRITILDSGHYEPTVDCPLCSKGTAVDCSQSSVQTCLNAGCDRYLRHQDSVTGRCEGRRARNECRKKLVVLDHDTVLDLPVTVVIDETRKGAGLRRLQAILARARSFIDSTGTHHATKSGPHTASATETHTAAAKSKKIVRKYYIALITEAMEHDDVDAKARKEAANVIKQLRNK